MIDATQDNEKELLERVQAARTTGAPVEALLKTDERVFARITDGIYREPASALRELIANSYDADASEVRITTDAPRFSRISVRDDGHGLTESALVHVICHIGGSLKRTSKGREFDVVDAIDRNLSPGGRKLIGKLGIGLFSVSQLTHHLVIVTKVKGENVRRVCDIFLMPQKDQAEDDEEGKDFVTGKAEISTLPAEDIDAQGTEINLLEIRPFIRESLQSGALWAAIAPESNDSPPASLTEDQGNNTTVLAEEDFLEPPIIPSFHIGQVSRSDPETLTRPANLPWEADDSEDEKFLKLVNGVAALEEARQSANEKIKLSEVLDTYLRTIWTLSLSVPLRYVETHPFSLKKGKDSQFFSLSNRPIRPSAEPITLTGEQKIRDFGNFKTDDSPSITPFTVVIDGISLRRPIHYSDAKIATDNSLFFFGKIRSDMSTLPEEYSGGPLEFEGYLSWKPHIAPIEHNGLMIRINGASGILFDDSFLKYQISEQTRLRQITGEIFIIQGLDAALNIDRESFNIAHPHYQFLKKWVHHSLRQLMSKHKSLNKSSLDERLLGGLEEARTALSRIVADGGRQISEQDISESLSEAAASSPRFVFDKATVLSPRSGLKRTTKTEKLREELIAEQIGAVAAVLEDFEFFSSMPKEKKNEILRKIVAIFTVDFK